ncbi:MAG: GH116 family glycosyl hydrolase, partial [Bacteroidota bacterium]|nr:GH116 family glycosyl hydrolase [Bacteroidota bacterium]
AAFHLYEKAGGDVPTVKCLSTNTVMESAWDKIKVGNGKYYALQPKGWTTYTAFKCDVSSKFFSPIVAHNYKETSYPVVIWEWQFHNPADENIDIALMFTWPNTPFGNHVRTGFNTSHQANGNINAVILKATHPDNTPETENSEWCIAVKDDTGEISYVSSWNKDSDGSDIWNDFRDDGLLSNGTLDGSQSAGAIAIKLTLGPGETKTVPLALTWDFPVVQLGWASAGTQWWKKYTEYFGTDSDNSFDIAVETLNNYQDWGTQVNAWMDPFLNVETIPDWLKCAAFNELYYSQFGGVFYEAGLKSGHTREFEGLHEDDHKHCLIESQQYNCYNPLDVRHYCSVVYARLWPEIERDTLRCFADAIEYHPVPDGHPDHETPHDVGGVWGDPYFGYQYPWNGRQWRDLPSQFIQQCWRYYYLTQDKAFLDYVWPACKHSFEHAKAMDTDNDFILNNFILDGRSDNTYDDWGLAGTSLFCGGLWVGALQCLEEMAIIEGDPILNDIQVWLSNARVNLDSQLWYPPANYYKVDTESDFPTAIMADSLNGQRYCEAYGLTDILPQARMKSHLQQIYQRLVVPLYDYTGDGIGDVGAQNGKKEDGTNLDSYQANEIWIGSTYFLTASMYHAGLIEEAMKTAYGLYYITYEEESTAYWFNTPEAWDNPGISPRPPQFYDTPHQYMRPRAVWELMFEIKAPINKIAVASSVEGPGFEADKAIDGDFSTRWSSEFSDPQWIYIDFGESKTFSTVTLDWEAAYGKAYEIQVSDDAEN